jgi:N-succinyldiaminopimelate aminotransferase
MTEGRLPHLSARLQGFGTTVFAEMTRLAVENDAVNLGQGFPDFDGPEFVKEAAVEALRAGHNQYARTIGVPALNRAVADHQRRFYGLDLDPDDEVTIYSGATEAIFAACQALLDTGDEVVVFEPFYDSYPASVAMAGGVMRAVTLRSPEFAVDASALEAVVSPRTRAILVNTPHNPTGRVFTRDELEAVARICRERDLIAICDEVYEHIVLDGEHVNLATLPGMRERTITISSLGKSFGLTGWKLGWSCAPAGLSRALRAAHQFVTFSTATPLQHAAAVALAAGDDYYERLADEYRERRDLLCGGLERAGFVPVRPAGSYFVLADIRPLGYQDDVEFCLSLPRRVGVVAVPPTAFYVDKAAGRHLARFAFCKTPETLAEGIRRLERLRS